VKLARKPSSGNPNAGFDVAGAGNVLKYFSGAPVLDPTADTLKQKVGKDLSLDEKPYEYILT